MRVMQAFLSMAALGGLLMSVSAPVARADDHAKCQHNIAKAEHRLDDACAVPRLNANAMR